MTLSPTPPPMQRTCRSYRRGAWIAALALVFALPLSAQTSDSMTDAPAFVSPPTVPTAAEEAVRAILATPGVHVVHFWAPWCQNSIDELPAWHALLNEERPDATFAFVTAWNNGRSGREKMDNNGIPSDVVEITQADRGPSGIKELRRKEFLGLPMTWIPSTWIFRSDTLAYALNYGEASESTLRALIADAQRGW